jgi:hypothetical protein
MADDDTGTTDQTDPPAEAAGRPAGTPGKDEAWENGDGKGSKTAVLAELAELRRARKVAEKQLAELKQASMSEQERAVAEAEQRGSANTAAAYGGRLARAELRAAAAGRVAPETLDGFLEYADLTKFVGEDGEPNSKAIAAAVQKLAAGGGGGTNFDGGARTPAEQPADMNSLIRRMAGVGR